MKTNKMAIALCLFALSGVTVLSCQAKAHSKASGGYADKEYEARSQQNPTNSAHKTELERLGFYVFDTPRAIPAATLHSYETDKNGTKDISTKSLAGKVTLLNFWATWCPPCKEELPSIQRLHDTLKDSSFSVVAVSTGEKASTVREFIESKGYTFSVYLDEGGNLGQSLASQGIPTTYLLNKEGMVVAGTVGAKNYDDPDLVKLLKAMADE